MAAEITERCAGCSLCKRRCPVEAIRGERGQRHSVDAGLCIACNACGRICAFGAVVDGGGAVIGHRKPGLWLRPDWNYARCTACNICVQACPSGVIGRSMPDGSGRGHALPYLADAKGCIGCSFCAAACPVEAIGMIVPG